MHEMECESRLRYRVEAWWGMMRDGRRLIQSTSVCVPPPPKKRRKKERKKRTLGILKFAANVVGELQLGRDSGRGTRYRV
jgi:hypothetical protein